MRVTVEALRTFDHGGRSYTRGEPVTVEPVIAAALHRRGDVSLAPGYRATDMRAVEPVPVSEPELEPEPIKPKRRYRRRDLQAEV